MSFQSGNNLSPPPPRRFKGDSLVTYFRARRAAQLHVFGLCDDEIAKLLGCTSRTVRNYLAMPEIQGRVNAMIEEADKRVVMLRFVSIVSKMRGQSALLDDLEKHLAGSVGQQQKNSCPSGCEADAGS